MDCIDLTEHGHFVFRFSMCNMQMVETKIELFFFKSSQLIINRREICAYVKPEMNN